MTGQGTSLPATPSQRGHMRQKWQKDRGNQRGTRARRTTRGPERADRGGSRGARAEGARGEPGPRGLAGSQGQQNRPAEDRTRQKNPRQPEPASTRTVRTAPRKPRPAANHNAEGNLGQELARATMGRQRGLPLTGTDNARATTHGHRQRASNHSRAPTTRRKPECRQLTRSARGCLRASPTSSTPGTDAFREEPTRGWQRAGPTGRRSAWGTNARARCAWICPTTPQGRSPPTTHPPPTSARPARASARQSPLRARTTRPGKRLRTRDPGPLATEKVDELATRGPRIL